MNTKYDQVLSERIKHLTHYPNYLPHISANYENAKLKVLIVAESHYLHENYDDTINSDYWYDNHVEVKETLKSSILGINTREVIANYYNDRTHKPFRIFLNLEAAFKDIFTDAVLFKECAYINYFQRPAERNGQSIRASKRDHEYAFHNLTELIETINPDKVIFVSRKAFDSFKSNVPIVDYSKFNVVPHPASAWWNKKSPRYGVNNEPSTGREKFIRIISKQ